MALIELQNASLSLGGQSLLKDLKVSFNPEERVAILGPSGSGKTLLLKLLIGLFDPTEGQRIKSENFENLPLGMVFQHGALFDSWTVFENMSFVTRYQLQRVPFSEAEIVIKKVLEMVELWEVRDLFAHQLSGGMRKRLALARALVLDPKILALDEPTAGLDPLTSEKVLEELEFWLTEREISFFLATSEPRLAKRLCKRLIYLEDGKIEFDGDMQGSAKTEAYLRSMDVEWKS